jgi:uncharacterized membrane protein
VLEQVSQILFGAICHQDPSALLIVDGRALLLCPRCMGLHLGFLFTFVLLFICARGRTRPTRPTILLVITPAVASMCIDWFVGGKLGLFAPTSVSRLVTGLACGSGLAMLLVAYRGDSRRLAEARVVGLSVSRAALIAIISSSVGVALALTGSWVTITSILIVSVMANAVIAAETAASMWWPRRRHVVVRRHVGSLKGGAV